MISQVRLGGCFGRAHAPVKRPKQTTFPSANPPAQEETNEPYTEEEVAEAILPALRWRAEGRAQKIMAVRGGVLADQVGETPNFRGTGTDGDI
jgi:hypothetical protein